MKKLLRCGISTLLIAMLSIQMLCINAVAAEHPSMKLPVTIEQKGDYPYKAEELNVVLKAADTACPMPEGSADSVYTLPVTSGTTGEFPEITFPKLGVYNYTIQQEAGDHSRGNYDETVYQMRVYVTNAESGEGFESTVLLYIDDINTKYASVTFENSYKEAETEDDDPPPTTAPTEPPTTAPPQTPEETMPVDKIRETEGDPVFDPFGVLGAFDEFGNPIGLLPATGTLWWVVPILALGGVVLMVLGRRRSRESDGYDE